MLNEKQAFLLQWLREEFDTLTMLGNDRNEEVHATGRQ